MEFWKPGTLEPGSSVERDAANEDEYEVLQSAYMRSSTRLTMGQTRRRLPIFSHREEILCLLEKFQVLIIVGQTGSGKTTQIPQYILEAGLSSKVIACTQPRRVAATSIANRVAEEMGVALGSKVGYAVRFDERWCDDTRIKYLTDGMLFREAMVDPLLSGYDYIMIDEAHERSLYTDLVLGLLKKYGA